MGLLGGFSTGEQFTLPLDARSYRTARFPWSQLNLADYDYGLGGYRLFPELSARDYGITPGGIGWIVDITIRATITIFGTTATHWEQIGAPLSSRGVIINGRNVWAPMRYDFPLFAFGGQDYYRVYGETLEAVHADAAEFTMQFITPRPIVPTMTYGVTFGATIRYIPYAILRPKLHV